MASSTSNIFINEILSLFPWNEEYGIYSSDTIPKQLSNKKRFTIICNESRQHETGTHFIIIIRRNDTILYLDPLATYLEIHDDIRVDNYFWMNEKENEEVIDYLERENDYYNKMTAHTKKFQGDLFQEMKIN